MLSRIVSRLAPLAPIAVVVVIAAVGSISIWAALETDKNTAAMEDARTLDDIYERASTAVSAEAAAHSAYVSSPNATARKRYNDAATKLNTALADLADQGEMIDRGAAENISRLHASYLREDARLFRDLDKGATLASLQPRLRDIEQQFDDVRQTVRETAGRHRIVVDERIKHQRRASHTVAVAIPIISAVGFVLVALFASIMISYRRKAQSSADQEISRLAEVARTDNLTGMGNHRALHEQLEVLEEWTWTSDMPCSMFALDLDGLKIVNDTLGHHEGDRLIRRLAKILTEMLPTGARAFRIGGDEFVALLPFLSAAEGYAFSQELQTALAPPQTGLLAGVVDDVAAPTHVTVGICDTVASDGNLELALKRADLALIEAKRMQQRGLIWGPGIVQPTIDNGTADHRRMLATALAKAVDAKDSYTRSHCETVSQLCVLIAEQLDMDPDDVESLRLAGLLHDVGKIGVPDAILQKPDKLTDDEFEQMQQHSTLGHSIVAAAGLEREASWVRHHHERVDGRGYPDRKAGEEIPIQSRIIFVADAFEAITSDRPYRLGRPVEVALEELQRCSGSQFDPQCVEALVRAMHRIGNHHWTPASAKPQLRVITTQELPEQAEAQAA